MCNAVYFFVLARYSAMRALGYFQSRVQQIVEKYGKSAMFWDEFWVRVTRITTRYIRTLHIAHLHCTHGSALACFKGEMLR